MRTENKSTPETLIAGVIHLLSLPEVYTRLEETLKQPNHTREDITNVIKIDPALCARVLRIVNSSYYAFPKPVESIAIAVNLIGEYELRNIVLVTSVVNSISSLATEVFDLQLFWQHSIRTGITAKLLAKQQPEAEPETLFLCGLLHDLGQLIIYYKEPELCNTVLEQINIQNRERYQVEQYLLGFDHALIGSLLMEQWGLPTILTKVILYHHQNNQTNPYPIETKLVSLADKWVRFLELNANESDFDDIPLPIIKDMEDLQIQKDAFLSLLPTIIEQSQAIEAIICEN